MIDKKGLITHFNPRSPISEAYRTLRTNLRFLIFNKQLKSILITSAYIGEGKSTITSNLAITMAQSENKVLLVDGDLRKPSLHYFFGVSNENGLTNLLVSKHENYQKFIICTGIQNLDLLASGPTPPNPSELLGSDSMKKFLKTVSNDYDIILIDTPPVGTVTDAAVLSTMTDGVILVVSSGEVEIKLAQKAKDLLLKVNANILGVVLNKVRFNVYNGYYYNYYYYYSNKKLPG